MTAPRATPSQRPKLVISPHLAPDTRRLLQTYLDSFEKLELVRALRASGRPMSRDELETECCFAPDTVREVQGSLLHMKVIELDAEGKLVRLGPSTQDPAFQALMAIYEEDRLVVLSLLSTIAIERIRSMAAQAFADAFGARKKRGDDDG